MKGFALKYVFYVLLATIFVIVSVNILWHFYKEPPVNPPPIIINVTYDCIRYNDTIIGYEEFEQVLYGFLTDQCTVFHSKVSGKVTFDDIKIFVKGVDEDIKVYRVSECTQFETGSNNVFVNFDEAYSGIMMLRNNTEESNVLICEKFFDLAAIS